MTFAYYSFLSSLLIPAFWGSSNAADLEWAVSTPPIIPLALRSPYLNIWAYTAAADSRGPSMALSWPTSRDQKSAGWLGLVRVDGVSYRWQGLEGASNIVETVRSSVRMSPTRTTFQAVAGSVQLNITYLSPIEPSNWVKQSFPFSYISIDVTSTDGQEHDVQLYSDITGELLSADLSQEVTFNTTTTSKSIFHSLRRSTPSPFLETADKPEDGTLYLGAPSSPNKITWQTGSCSVARTEFSNSGTLSNEQDPTNTRKIHQAVGNLWVCISLAYNLGSISSTSSPAVWALGLVREPSIRTATARGPELRSLYFWTGYSSIDLAIDDFLANFEEATRRAQALDTKIMTDGIAISQSYADLLAFSARLAFGAMDITVARTSPTALNSSDVKVYMKDVGRSSRSNAVDLLFSAFPAFLYLNANLTGLLLEPLLEFQSSHAYHNNYSASDLGSSYPDIKGNTSQTALGLEASGSMLIMALAHARKSGDGTLCQRYFDHFKRWADYLSDNALDDDSFVTSDMSVPKGNVNLALKAIIGVQAMSAINKFLEPQGASPDDTNMYSNKVQNLIQQWKELTWKSNHFAATFGEFSSWSLIYNSYADKLLNTSLISDDKYKTQASFYAGQISDYAYGLPYDSRLLVARSDWTMLTAAALSNTPASDFMIKSIHKRASWKAGAKPWPTLYNASIASGVNGHSSPGHGASFALLTLNLPDLTIRLNTSLEITPKGGTSNASSKAHIAGPVAGGVIGGIVLLCLVAFFGFWYRRKRAGSLKSQGTESLPVPAAHGPVSRLSMSTHSRALNSGGPRRDSKAMLKLLFPHAFNEDPSSHSPVADSDALSPSRSVSPRSSTTSSVIRNEVEELRLEMAAIRSQQAPGPLRR